MDYSTLEANTMMLQVKMRNVARLLLERVARIVLGEPARVVPARKMDRLDELERREQLQAAERRGDSNYLDGELAKSQLTEGDLDRLGKLATPIEAWPDENFEDCFRPAATPPASQS
jgi:hypothetical protein